MVNEKLRKAIQAYDTDHGIQETYGDIILLDNQAYDNSIIGITEDGIVMYDYNKMVQEFAAEEHCSKFSAMEWIDYNTLRAIPYMGKRHPIIVQETPESLLEKYGD